MISIKEANAPVADNLKRWIEMKDFKKKAVAARAGLTQNELTDIFGGRRIIKMCELPELAEAVGIPMEKLFEQSNE